MNDERLRDAYERGLPGHDGSPALDDVAAERLRRLVEREGSEEERLRTLDSMLSSAEGRRELEIAWAAARAARPSRPTWRRYSVAAAVLVSVGLAGVWWRLESAQEIDVLRGGESPITLVAPLGSVSSASPARFVWRAIARAERYTLVLVDTAGTELYASETRDTAVALPDSVRLEPGRAYLWWVQARRTDQSTVTAVTQRVVALPP
jgi:hypothetical protein